MNKTEAVRRQFHKLEHSKHHGVKINEIRDTRAERCQELFSKSIIVRRAKV